MEWIRGGGRTAAASSQFRSETERPALTSRTGRRAHAFHRCKLSRIEAHNKPEDAVGEDDDLNGFFAPLCTRRSAMRGRAHGLAIRWDNVDSFQLGDIRFFRTLSRARRGRSKSGASLIAC